MQRRRLRRLQRRSLLLTECFRVFGFSAQRPALGRIRLWQRVRTVFPNAEHCVRCGFRWDGYGMRYERGRISGGRFGLPDAAGREILAGQDGCLRRGPVAVRSGSGRSDCGIYGTSEDGLPSFGRLSEGLRYPAAANRGKLIIFIAVSVSVGMYPTVRPFNGERL